MRASFLLGIFKIKTKRKDCPSVNNGIAGIPENRLGFVGEATYLPHLNIGAIRKGRPFFWAISKYLPVRRSRLCNAGRNVVAIPICRGPMECILNLYSIGAKSICLFCSPIPKIP